MSAWTIAMVRQLNRDCTPTQHLLNGGWRTVVSPSCRRYLACGLRCDPQPSTLHPRPSTLHPQPFTLNPQPFTLNPHSFTLNPQPSTLHPQLLTLNPSPSNLHPPRGMGNPPFPAAGWAMGTRRHSGSGSRPPCLGGSEEFDLGREGLQRLLSPKPTFSYRG